MKIPKIVNSVPTGIKVSKADIYVLAVFTEVAKLPSRDTLGKSLIGAVNK